MSRVPEALTVKNLVGVVGAPGISAHGVEYDGAKIGQRERRGIGDRGALATAQEGCAGGSQARGIRGGKSHSRYQVRSDRAPPVDVGWHVREV